MATITIVGVGALGSHAVLFLRSLRASIRVVDYDRVETKNVASQFHGSTQVGKNKVQSVQQTMNFLFKTKVDGIPHKLTGQNTKQLLGGSDLIVDCLDNGPSRRLVQEYAKSNSIPCLHGALAADGGFGRVVWSESFQIDEGATGAATCEDGAHLPFIALVSSYLAYSAQQFLLSGKKMSFNIFPGGVARF